MQENDLKILLFSDFHYKKGLYPPSVEQLSAILKRGAEEKVDLALHAGDICNDYKGAPELLCPLLENPYDIPVYGVYGNHELEFGNVMEFVTPRLSNRDDRVFGTPDGSMGDGSIGYAYVDRKGFRIVLLDSNYSYSETRDAWEHNPTLRRPEGNILGDSLGPVQLAWLEKTLTDAAHKGIPCIVVAHAGFYPNTSRFSPDLKNVMAIYRRVNAIRKGTVLMSINGHYHENHLEIVEDVLYMDMNTSINGHWQPRAVPHYSDEHTFLYTDYDENGTPRFTEERKLSTLRGAEKTWFFRDPLSAVLTLSHDGTIRVDGMETEWLYGISPVGMDIWSGTDCRVSSGTFHIERD